MATIDSLAFFRVVLISTLLTCGAILLAMLFQRVFPRASASVRHAVWLAAIVVALVLPITATFIPMQWGDHSSLLQQAIRVDEVVVPSEGQRAEAGTQAPSTQSVVTIERSAAERVARFFTLVWMIGIAGVLLHLASSAIRLHSVIGSARPLNHRMLADCLPAGCDRVTIRQTGAVDLPLTAGVVRPLILLPEAAVDSWSNRRLRVALLHEVAHVNRRDVAWQIAGRIACALHWFNPLVWVAARNCARAAEQSCDDAVLDAGIRPSSYAGHLLEIARWASDRNSFALAVGQGSELEGRITAVLAPTRARRGLSRRALQQVVWAAAFGAVVVGTHRVMGPGKLNAEPGRPAASRPTEPGVDAALVRLLDDEDPAVRAAAARSAGELQVQAAIQPLLRTLRDPHPQVRSRAAHSLGELENPAGIAGLSEALLSDPDISVRREAASALGEIETDAAARALSQALHQLPVGSLRRQIIRALGETRSTIALPILEELIDGDDEQARRTALEALTQVQSPEATRLLLRATSSQNAETRRVAARAIADAHR